MTPTGGAGVINTDVATMRLLLPPLGPQPGTNKPNPAKNKSGGNTNNKLFHIDVADANRRNTDNLHSGEGNATVHRCSEVNVKRATAHDYSATIPPLEKYA